jgi:hypothetical protein
MELVNKFLWNNPTRRLMVMAKYTQYSLRLIRRSKRTLVRTLVRLPLLLGRVHLLPVLVEERRLPSLPGHFCLIALLMEQGSLPQQPGQVQLLTVVVL